MIVARSAGFRRGIKGSARALVIKFSHLISPAALGHTPKKITTTAMASKEGSYTYAWPRAAVTVDAILVSRPAPLQVLLIQRKQDPYAGAWALPGGFVDELEPLHVAAARELQEETSVDPTTVPPLLQIGAFGNPGRDPRGWTVGVAFATLVDTTELGVKAADDAAAAAWHPIEALPPLAFDHGPMLKATFERLALEPETAADSELLAALKRAAAKLS